jgi:hypothetical protein
MRPSIQRALEEKAEAAARLDAAVRRAQKTCRHLDLIEADYLPMYEGALPPIRACCSCGMTEDGWGCGYIVLKGRVHQVSRDLVYQTRQGLHISDDDKGPLLRGETTVAALVDKRFNKE